MVIFMFFLDKIRRIFSRLRNKKGRERGDVIGRKGVAVVEAENRALELQKMREKIIRERAELKERILQIEKMYGSGKLNWATREEQVKEILIRLVKLRRRLNKIDRELEELTAVV